MNFKHTLKDTMGTKCIGNIKRAKPAEKRFVTFFLKIIEYKSNKAAFSLKITPRFSFHILIYKSKHCACCKIFSELRVKLCFAHTHLVFKIL